MHRSEAIVRLMPYIGNLPVVSNLGPTSDELRHVCHRDRNFYTYGSMGLCTSIAVGMALSTKEKVISMDGDGSLLMNLGTLATVGREDIANIIIVVWDNEEWAQTGHQPSHTAFGTNLETVARGCGIRKVSTVHNLEDLELVFQTALTEDGPWLVVAKVVEADYLPVAPIEPEATLYRFRSTFTQK